VTYELFEYIILGLVLAGCVAFILINVRRKLKAFGPNATGCDGCGGCGGAGKDEPSCPSR